MQSVGTSWQIVWGLLSATFVLGGLAVLLKGLCPKPVGMAPHCPKCGYNLTGSASVICPECGAARQETACKRCGREFADAADVCPHCGGPRVMDTAVYGEYRRSRGLIVAAGILVLLGLTSAGVLYRSMPRTVGPPGGVVSNNIRNAKLILAGLRQDFVAGRAVAATSRPADPPDSRMGILALIVQDKMRYLVNRRIPNPSVVQAATAQLAASSQLIQSQLLPAHNKARQSGKPDDAKALVPLLDQLDKQLDALTGTVKGY